MREFLNKHGKYVAGGLVLLAVLLCFLLMRGGPHLPKSAYFIDEDTGQESVRSRDDVPPLIGAKGNPSIVKVYKYNYEDDATVRVGYYCKFPPEIKAKIDENNLHPNPSFEVDNTMLIRKPDAGPNGWVKAHSAEGDKILNSLVSASGKNPQAVYP